MPHFKKSQIIVIRGSLVNDVGKILLVPRKTKNNKLVRYELPGGKLEFGERPQEALTREFSEETGLEVDVLRPYHIFSATDQLAKNQLRYTLELTFLVRLKNSTRKVSQAFNKDIIWLGEEDLESQPLTDETRDRIKQAIAS